ncbi:MAG TPA: thiamine phosphate synthase [Clostridiales bacterium]|nr:thiamine phosphate synthase [Clostridiales bacterium]
MKKKVDYTLYLCTDRSFMSTNTIEESVELALEGGCTVVQLREKDCSSKDFYDLAIRVKTITHRYDVPLIINDRVDIALAVNADGVHVGQSDLPASVVRKIIGDDKIIGVSASTKALALQAVADGADYLGVGAMYSTNTKTDAGVITIDTVKEIRKAVDIPMVVIGGINKNTVSNVKGIGVDGICVISAIVAQQNITQAAKDLKELFMKP